MATTNQPKRPNSPKDYENLGRMLQSLYESGYISRKEAYKMTFMKGVLAGFGGVIGATIVVALLLWVLSLFDNVPFVNQITDNVQCTLQQGGNSPSGKDYCQQ